MTKQERRATQEQQQDKFINTLPAEKERPRQHEDEIIAMNLGAMLSDETRDLAPDFASHSANHITICTYVTTS